MLNRGLAGSASRANLSSSSPPQGEGGKAGLNSLERFLPSRPLLLKVNYIFITNIIGINKSAGEYIYSPADLLINQGVRDNERLRPHHEGAARQGSN